jgi:predicted RNA binding protein YcfA (HicA-like mRNA interferase family)
MARREKLLEKMRRSPGNMRFSEVEALLKYEMFVLFNSRGSHRSYHHPDGRLFTIVVPHGRRKTCNPSDIRKLLGLLGQ